ncbi:MAG: primosomal protein N' [Oscillospiraceae bacterium]|jgi:primosomal protein N' (replication factor Y)|nr:primosomal protein N' [Oscillospiraceae bacterium]
MIVKAAVSALPFQADKIYDYRVPASLEASTFVGVRIMVPFGRGNSRREAIVLDIKKFSESGDYLKLKAVEEVLDSEPVIGEQQIALAKFMKARFYCTLYEALKAMLPTGVWYRDNPKRNELGGVESVTRIARAKAKTRDFASLSIPPDNAAEFAEHTKSNHHREIVLFLIRAGTCAIDEISYYTGAKRQSFTALAKRGYITIEAREEFRRPKVSELIGETASLGNLTPEQDSAYRELAPMLTSAKPEAALIYGITGSGKTAVYIKLIADALALGRGAIMLVPEIALTPQMTAKFTLRFGDGVAVLHSSLSVGERYDEWRRIRSGAANVVIGTRSAVFAPVRDTALIIIDEEHEQTYVSDSSPRYNVHDVAKFLCAQSGGLLVFGSATPAMESMYAAKTGRYKLVTLRSRFNAKPLPDVIIADMKQELRNGNALSVSSRLRDELEKNISSGEQSILFINRRGANTIVACPNCGKTFSCPSCSVNLTYHSANRRLMCHYCGHSRPVPSLCPDCGSKLKFIGVGTQQVEQDIHSLLPGAATLRMDADTITTGNNHEVVLRKFEAERVPILIGTQMVTKGLNFPQVTLVGVINPDNALYSCDFRAGERTFALITQVIGRAGRGDKPGRAVIQTFTPENQVIRLSAAQDYERFFESEIGLRQLSGNPPFTELHRIAIVSADQQLAELCAETVKHTLTDSLRGFAGVRVLGPTQDIILKVNNLYRYRVFISASSTSAQFRASVAAVIKKISGSAKFKRAAVFGINGG